MENYYQILKKRNIKDNPIIEYDYSKTLLKNVASEELFNSNNFFVGFLDKLNDILVRYVNSVKIIKTTANIATDKYETHIL